MAALSALAVAALVLAGRLLEEPETPPLPPDVGLGPLASSPAIPSAAGEDPVGPERAEKPPKRSEREPQEDLRPKPRPDHKQDPPATDSEPPAQVEVAAPLEPPPVPPPPVAAPPPQPAPAFPPPDNSSSTEFGFEE